MLALWVWCWGWKPGLPLYSNILAVAMKFLAAEFWVRTLTTVNMVISMYHV